MPSLKFSNTNYRYGFNGKENDPETGTQDYGERIYDGRIGRFFTPDPISFDYPFYTPYQFAGNDVIAAVDVDGLEPGYQKGNGVYVTARDGGLQQPMSAEQQKQLDAGMKGRNGYENSRGTSMTLDLIPVVGTAKGWIEAATGNDLITGEPLPTWVRWASVIPYGKIASKGKLLIKSSTSLVKAAGKTVKFVGKLPCGCFTEETQILTNFGYKDIKNIIVGDSVWSYNLNNKALELRKVIKTLNVSRDSIYKIYFNNQIIEATEDHPFYVGGNWIEVNSLNVGDSLTLFNLAKVEIIKIEIVSGNYDVYNFEVEGLHNYLVSSSKVLVHNGICDVVYNGFYKVVKSDGFVYIGKGADGRAAKSLAREGGDKVSWFKLTEGVAERSLDETAYIMEYLAMVAEKAPMTNKIASKGATYFSKLTDEAKEIFVNTFKEIQKAVPDKIIEKK
jgi:RHS repeat-associated protein